MRILFVSVGDPTDASYWSGLPSWMYRSLVAAGCEVEVCAPLNDQVKYLYTVPKLVARWRGRAFMWDRAPALLASFAQQISKRLREWPCDIVFSPSTIPIAALKCRQPIVFWTDAVI